MKRFGLLFLTVMSLLLIACQQENNPSGGKDVTILCATGEADEITVNSATLKGTVLISDARAEQADVWFLIGTDATTVSKNGMKVAAGALPAKGGNVSAVATGLESETTYYFMVEASIDGKMSSGEVSSFSTLARPKEMIVTAETSNVTETTALLYGYANLPEDMTGVHFGIICSTDSNPSLDNGTVVESKELDRNNKYFSTFTGLQPSTKYYYKAFLNAEGFYRVGEVKSFTTSDFGASVTTGDATDVGLFEATINGSLTVESGDDLSRSVWFLLCGEDNLDALKTSGNRLSSSLGEDGKFTYTFNTLNYNTKYYYVACAKVHDREYFGEVKSFTTSDFGASVTTGDATDVGLFEATINGSLTTENAEGLNKDAWFLYSYESSSLDALKTNGTVAQTSINGNTFSSVLENLRLNKTYYYVAVARVHDKEVYGTVASFTTKTRTVPSGAVELELSVLWATCNLGATAPEGYGDYYAWGETETKENYNWSTYKWCNGSYNTLTKYNTKSDYGTVDNKTILEPEDDVAHVKLGGSWRMPTDAEWTELHENCTWTWTTQNGVNGRLVTSNKNGNSIFLPAAGTRYGTSLYDVVSLGYYWSSSLYTGRPYLAWYVDLYSGYVLRRSRDRCSGQSVRPVSE